MFNLVVAGLIDSLSKEIVAQVQLGISKKYSVDIKAFDYIIDSKVTQEFQLCLNVAIEAFIGFLAKTIELDKLQQSSLGEYLKSPIVCEEIWHLLDPGSEYFDRGKLTEEGFRVLSSSIENLEPELLFDAWEEFLKAFSFASRSGSHLREFLRASYEAGSFRVLSNMEDILQKMQAVVNEVSNQELVMRRSIEDHMAILKEYEEWARTFPVH